MAGFLQSLVGGFRGNKDYLGVDIGTNSIKVVELGSGSRPTLKNYGILESYGHLERLNNAIQTSNLKLFDQETVELIKVLMKQTGTQTRDAVASLPAFTAFTSLIDIPLLSPEETSQAMEYQARSFVPLPISEVTIDWIPVGEFEDEQGTKKQKIFLVSIPNDYIRKYQRIFKEAGLTLRALEIESLSLARVLTAGDPTTTLIVDIGSRSTALAVAENGFLKHSGQTDFASSSLTQAIKGGLGINIFRAEELKKQKGLKGTEGEYEISTLMLPFLDVILNEVKRVKATYEKDYRGKIERIMLSGGGSNLIGIEEYVGKQFDIPVIKALPFDKIAYPRDIEPLVGELGASFAVALGLGVRQFMR